MVKKLNKLLTLQQIRDIIEFKIIEIGTEPEPRWGFDKQVVCAILNNVLIEIEEKFNEPVGQ